MQNQNIDQKTKTPPSAPTEHDPLHRNARATADKILSAYNNKINDYLNSEKLNYKQAQEDYIPNFYQSLPALNFQIELPDRTKNISPNSLAQKAIETAINALLIKRLMQKIKMIIPSIRLKKNL